MMLAFADEGGHSQSTDFVSMAFWVGRWDQWKEFNRRWQRALAANGAPYLHMREYAHSRGAFEGWNENRRVALMRDCLACLDDLRIVVCAACMRVADFQALSPGDKASIADPYYACFQECIHGMQLAAYLGFPGDRTNVVYSQQDEFGRSFRRIFEITRTSAKDGARLGVLSFQDMRNSPGLQLADLAAYELQKYYQRKQDAPNAAPRHPFRTLCEHQFRMRAGMWKFITSWQILLKLHGGSSQVMRAMFADWETWRPLLDQTVPEPARLQERYGRLSLGAQTDLLDRLTSWSLHSDYDPDVRVAARQP